MVFMTCLTKGSIYRLVIMTCVAIDSTQTMNGQCYDSVVVCDDSWVRYQYFTRI